MYKVIQFIIRIIILKSILLYICNQISIYEVLYMNIQTLYVESYEPNS